MEITRERSSSVHSNAGVVCKSSAADRLDWLIPLALFVFTVVYLSAFLRYSALEPDEGILLEGAQRILDGQLPYRDFFSFYTPGSFYLVAGLFRIFGDSFAVARFSIAIIGALFPVLTFALARRGCSRGMAAFVALLTALAGGAYRFLVLHNWYSTFLACLALYAVMRMLETHRPVWAFTAGSLCALTALFEQSKGAGLCLGLVLGFWTVRFARRKQLFRGSEWAGVSAGLAWPFLLVAGYFGAKHSLSIMLKDWIWPLRHYGLANHVRYGYQNWSDYSRGVIFHTGPAWAIALKVLVVSPGFIVPVLPFFAVGFYAYGLLQLRRGAANPQRWACYVVSSGALIGVLLSVVLSRADIIHFMYLIPLWLVPMAWTLDISNLSSALLLRCRACLIAFLAASFGLTGFAILSTATGAHNELATRRGVIRTDKADTVIPYLTAHNVAGQAILVYPYLPLYYYLTGTRSLAGLDYFQPGMNTSEQAEEILSSLSSHPDAPVLLEPAFLGKIGTSWPGTPIADIARDPLGDYIARTYRVCGLLHSPSDALFEYMVRGDRKCP